ncbi:MAG: ATP-dependent RNA helicase HrpA [Gammaproteobacteria bacterium]|nr:ATP-dependent RNA helicase HrpA [Gammaproteobacteria bacterium]
MSRDAHAFDRASRKNRISQKDLRRFVESADEVQKRVRSVPQVRYQTDLPIVERLPEIESMLKRHQVLIVAGETGSGKTTQIPLACLEAGLGVRGMICHTQPRRLAARSVADRIASQLNVSIGEEVGYAVRFEDRVGPDTLVKIVTDGLLLTEIQRNRYLNSYDTIIVDEAHERSLNIDFLLGYLKSLLAVRRDLRVVITSATIDVEEFSKFFGNAPVVSVVGRTYPVDIRYRPIERDIETAVSECISEIRNDKHSQVRDILMFLSGEREIFEWSHWFRKNYANQFEVLPLYARLPPKEQHKIFQTSGKQRVLLSTNVAETSLTVPNIRYVIDVGSARISRYSLQSQIQRLPIEQISQASADQRAGRCGRLAPGTCFRLYGEDDYSRRLEYTVPEIRRTNLASVVLQMLVFRFGDIDTFPFLDRPDNRAFASAKRMLRELGALEDESVTPIGQRMARLPIDPRLARMLIEADKLNALNEVLTIVSAIAAQDPRLRPLDRQMAADLAHEKFRHKSSDFMSFVQLWYWLEIERKSKSRRQFRRLLETHFISFVRYEEWRSLHRQLRIACTRMKMRFNRKPAKPDEIHRAILSGSLNFVGLRTDRDNYVGMREMKFRLFPGSTLAGSEPKWVVAAEIAETSQTFARCVAPIEPRWVEEYAGSLLRRSTHDPYWNSKRATSMVLVDLSLSGLTIAVNRREKLNEYDATQAQKIFARHALVKDEGRVNVPEVQANRELVSSLKELEARERSFNVVASEQQQATYYTERLPESVTDTKSFMQWYRNCEESSRSGLTMSPEDVLLVEKIHLREDAFPSELHVESSTFPLKYTFAPGQLQDGVSVQVTPSTLHLIDEELIEWLVPGLLETKCLELLRSLPKPLRKKLAPIPDRVVELTHLLLRDDVFRGGSMLYALAELIKTQYSVDIYRESWDTSRLSPHLFMNVQVVASNGNVIDQDRNVQELQQRIAKRIEDQVDSVNTSKYELQGITSFPNEGIDWERTLTTASGPVAVYTHLLDRKDGVDIRLLPQPPRSPEESLWGLCRLVCFAEKQSVAYLRSEFEKQEELRLSWLKVGPDSELFDSLLLRAISRVYFADKSLIATKNEFDEVLAIHRGRLVQKGIKLLDLTSEIVRLREELSKKVGLLGNSPAFEIARSDLSEQLDALVPPTLLRSHNDEFLNEVPRYLHGINARIEGLAGKLKRDIVLTEDIQTWEKRFKVLRASGGNERAIEDLRLNLQEYRLSLFCQNMKTRIRVSAKRLEEKFVELERESPKSSTTS